LPALTLAAAEYGHDVRTGEAVSMALRRALFEDGRDIPDDRLLRPVAASWDLEGVDKRLLGRPFGWGLRERARCPGVTALLLRRHGCVLPTLDIERAPVGHLLLARNRERLNAFLDICSSSGPESAATEVG